MAFGHCNLHLLPHVVSMATNNYEMRLLTADLDQMRKSDMVQLCRGLGLPHSGLKAAMETRLRTKLTEPQAATPTTTSTGPFTTFVAATITHCHHGPHDRRVWPSYLGGSAPISPPPASHRAASRATGAGTSTLQHTTSPTSASAANATPWCGNPAHHNDAAHGLPPLAQHIVQHDCVLDNAADAATNHPWELQAPGHTPDSAAPEHYHHSPSEHAYASAPARPVTANPLYLPPAASWADIHAQQMQLLAEATPAPPLHRMGTPPLPVRLQARVLAGEFVDMSDILHTLELDVGEELPINLEVGEGH